MPFDPERPRTEDREFHPEQANLDKIAVDLARIAEGMENPQPALGDSEKGRLQRTVAEIEEQARRIKEKVG